MYSKIIVCDVKNIELKTKIVYLKYTDVKYGVCIVDIVPQI